MHERTDRSDGELIVGVDRLHEQMCSALCEIFAGIAELDRRQCWRDSGARDMAHWVSMRYGISGWKARRWIAAAYALEGLPRLSEAFRTGRLSVDKVVELARFATPEDEASLIGWALRVSSACIRRRGDLAARRSLDDAADVQKSRFLSWWYFDEGRRFGLEGELSAADGAVVAGALERLARSIPVMPGEEHAVHADARRADALVMLASARLAAEPDPDRATVVVHAGRDPLVPGARASELEGGGVIDAETVRRLGCTARLQLVIEDRAGDPLRMGRITRDPPASIVRALRHRDRECTFPGCGMRRFTQAHHVVWWSRGGRTDIENLVLVCHFHHKLVHEHGWRIVRAVDGNVAWVHPDGSPYRAGPAPPRAAMEPAVASLGGT